jgi:hypothetical protein
MKIKFDKLLVEDWDYVVLDIDGHNTYIPKVCIQGEPNLQENEINITNKFAFKHGLEVYEC